jgi:hypothetical protein
MALQMFAKMTCRKCGVVNPMVSYAPVIAGTVEGTCICFNCVKARNWLDVNGDLKSNINL